MAGLIRNRALRAAVMALGLVFAGIGIVGIWVPLIPTTGPVLLAAYLFSKSSSRFDRWLVDHRIVGPIVRDWRAGQGFTIRLKLWAIAAIAVTFAITITLAVDSTPVRLGLVGLAIGLAVYILCLPTKRAAPLSDPAA